MIKVRVKKDALGDADEQSLFGQTAEPGKYVEVDDRFADKIKGNPTLETSGSVKSKSDDDDDDDAAKPRRGRPPGSGTAAAAPAAAPAPGRLTGDGTTGGERSGS